MHDEDEPVDSLASEPRTAIPLDDIVATLDSAVRLVVATADGETPEISTVALVETSDLTPQLRGAPQADLVLFVGVREPLAVDWLRALAGPWLAERPVALMIREDTDTPRLREAAASARVVLVVIDGLARWDVLLTAISRRLDRAQLRAAATLQRGESSTFNDLSELAAVIAAGAGGMVTIERPDSRVLAYSPSDGTADELRTRAILGREAPADSMRLLNEWGVMSSIQRTREVVFVPEHEGLGMRPRLVTGIHSAGGQFLGSIWLQEGVNGFSVDARTVVRGGASAAARVLTRELVAPSASEMMLQRVFGEHGGIDSGTAAAFLDLQEFGQAAVIGVAAAGPDETTAQQALERIARMLRLHIGAFAPHARFVVIGSRAYAVLPNLPRGHRLHDWAEQLVTRFDAHEATSGFPLHIAIVTPVVSFEQVPEARTEADRVLDATLGSSVRATSLTQSRTSVLLREAIELLSDRSELADPRMTVLYEYDERHRADLIPSLRSYVDTGFNAREAARLLDVHPNTLRYRIARAQELTGFDLTRPDDRLLLALQLEMQAASRRLRADRRASARGRSPSR